MKNLTNEASGYNISSTEVKDWLLSQDIYTRFHPARKRFPRNFYNIKGIDHVWEWDLNDMSSFSDDNHPYNYFICIICCLSRYVWTFPLKSKTAVEIAQVFDAHLTNCGRKPKLLQGDHEGAFTSREVLRVLKKHNVVVRTIENEGHGRMVERVNQTLKHRLTKYMEYKHTRQWVHSLPEVVRSYNNTPHSSIGMCPSEVTEKDVYNIWSQNYLRHMKVKGNGAKISANKLRVGDYVRVSIVKTTFEKGYTPRFSQQLYIIRGIVNFKPVQMYTLNTLNQSPVKGFWYRQELLRVQPPPSDALYRVEKIIDRRQESGGGGGEEVLVRWEGWDKDHDTWIPASNLGDI